MAELTIELGDELIIGEWSIVTQINGTNARIANKEGKHRIIDRVVNDHYLLKCGRYPDAERVKRLANFLSSQSASHAQELTQPIEAAKSVQGTIETVPAEPKPTEENEMTTKSTTSKRTRKTGTESSSTAGQKAKGSSKGRLGSIFGHSVVSVVRAAGKAGATFEQITAGLEKHKITAKESTVKANARAGKNGEPVAELTKEQLADFLG